MSVTVTLVGTFDRQLEDMLRAAGMRPTTVLPVELAKLAYPSVTPPDVLVLDLRKDHHIPAALAAVKRHHPGISVAIVASALDPALMIEAMRAGVNECVTNIGTGDLEAAITRLIAQKVAPDAGEAFAFVGAKGGVGTTTAAVNVATALAKVASTLLIDLHMTLGDAALLFGAEPRYSVVDALENTSRLDSAYFRGVAVRTKAGVDLLASSERPLVGPLETVHIGALIDFAVRHYRYTVLDVPRSDAAVLDSLEGAAVMAVVANQELTAIRAAARLAPALRSRYGKDKVQVVLSRSDRGSDIGHADVERAVGGRVKHTFPSDYRLALEAMNRGEPLVLKSQRPLAVAYRAYARDLAGVIVDESDQGAQAGLFGRLTSRK